MKRLLAVASIVVAIIVVIFIVPRHMTVKVIGGPDVEYEILIDGSKRAEIRRGEEIRLKRSGRVVSVAVDGKVIESKGVSKEIVFDLPDVEMPKVLYTYSSSVVEVSVKDENLYPIRWSLNGETPPATFEIPSSIELMGFLSGKKVFQRNLDFSKISKVSVTYDGSVLSIKPELKGFFKPSEYEVNGILSTDLRFSASSLPKKLEIKPLYGDVAFDGIEVEIPEVPEIEVDKDRVELPGSFLLNGRRVSGEVTLSDGTNVVEWVFEEGKMKFVRIWRIYVDKKPPKIEASFEKLDDSVVVNVKLDEPAEVILKSGNIVLKSEGSEVYFRLRFVPKEVEVIAKDLAGNVASETLEVGM